MGKIYVIGDKYTANLFRLVGAEGEVLENPELLPDKINEIKKREDVDLLLITYDLYNVVREKVEEVLANTKKPVVSIIPSPFSESKPVDAKSLLMKALGFG
ncbi:MAG: V-type ATP synthase subunit F [Thermoprotei archaeon]